MSIYFKTASIDDCDLLFEWANDTETRNNAFNSKPIDYSTHIKWFNTLNFDNVLIFYDESSIPIGLVRIDNKNKEWVITTMVDKNHRGKGFASEMLRVGSIEFFKKNTIINKIIAYIKESNTPSKKVFIKAGFIIDDIVQLHGFSCYKMFYSREK